MASSKLMNWLDDRHAGAVTFVELATIVGTLITLYATAGITGAVAAAVLSLAYFAYGRYKDRVRSRAAERRLQAELPKHQAFLVGFLRENYALPHDADVRKRNRGLRINSYDNSFEIDGRDCGNTQTVSGINVGDEPVAGVTFVLVGGSSVTPEDLGASFVIGNGTARRPQFLQDEDRRKIAFCPFEQPLQPQELFTLQYRDLWVGSMRPEADGLFYPESLIFPSGLGSLSSTVGFAGRVATISVLEVDVRTAHVGLHKQQPHRVHGGSCGEDRFRWVTHGPSAQSIFVLQYTLEVPTTR